ncbi:hypothetical protein [Roseiconus lacunae]|uniref:Uncharacterized protein n=1 Tax=Roseiconus lacunae TaxID=2605694 RepID=A0ABT7PGN1_9BACT|nr:hypothetical protein [Roseiconus lacunae]MDM4015633.1 hypothetical protein [Roseiconus lacunae]WRQ52678.1 hypothetical protein U8335_09045 [Stieleria sp. HD01]
MQLLSLLDSAEDGLDAGTSGQHAVRQMQVTKYRTFASGMGAF